MAGTIPSSVEIARPQTATGRRDIFLIYEKRLKLVVRKFKVVEGKTKEKRKKTQKLSYGNFFSRCPTSV